MIGSGSTLRTLTMEPLDSYHLKGLITPASTTFIYCLPIFTALDRTESHIEKREEREHRCTYGLHTESIHQLTEHLLNLSPGYHY